MAVRALIRKRPCPIWLAIELGAIGLVYDLTQEVLDEAFEAVKYDEISAATRPVL